MKGRHVWPGTLVDPYLLSGFKSHQGSLSSLSGTYSTCERGPSLVGSLLGSLCRYKRFCPALAALVSPVQNIFFLTGHHFTLFVHIDEQAGQAVVPHRLSLKKCFWYQLCGGGGRDKFQGGQKGQSPNL
jgi:hypothetical protein